MASVVRYFDAFEQGPALSPVKGRAARLTRKESDLLATLKLHAGKCLPRSLLLRTVWGYREGVRSRTLDVHIQRLRRKLGPAEGSHILTVFRAGYLWAPDKEPFATLTPAGAPTLESAPGRPQTMPS